MTVSLLASACPAVQVPSDLPLLADAYLAGEGALTGYELGQYSGSLLPPVNTNLLHMNLMARYGGAARCINKGLVISVPVSGLNIHVSAGHANIDGIIELPEDDADHTVDMANGTKYIWFKRNGVIDSTTSTTPPVDHPSVFLGSCVVASGNIVSVDFSGVMYNYFGTLFRQTADVDAPSDTPPATIMFHHKSLSGWFLWDGTAYVRIGESSSFGAIIAAGLTPAVPVGLQKTVMENLSVYGTLSVLGTLYVGI